MDNEKISHQENDDNVSDANNHPLQIDEHSDVLTICAEDKSTRSVNDHLIGRKVEEQLEELNAEGKCLTNQLLEQAFNTYLSQYPDLLKIHESNQFASTLNQLCIVKPLPRVLLQKLTLLKLRLPGVFEQTLFSTWLATLLAKELKISTDLVQNTFYVGLMHDLGLLHIDPAIVNKQSHYSEQEWTVIKQHMMISVAIAKLISPFDEEVYRGIKEHHERCDGTGYPHELHSAKLCYSGQLVGLADMICHLRVKQYQNTGKSMANIMPYMRINLHSFKFESYQAIYNVLKKAELDIDELLDRQTFISIPKRLILQRIRINQLHQAYTEFIKLAYKQVKGKHFNALLDSHHQIGNVINKGGFNSAETLDWLESITAEDFNHVHKELQELDDMHYELLWLFKKSFRLIPSFLNDEVPPESALRSHLKTQIDILEQNLGHAWLDYQ